MLDQYAKTATQTAEVEQISYDSPLEVVLTISAIGVSVTAFGSAVIAFGRKFDDLRTHMSGGRAQRAAMAAIVQDLEASRVSTGDLRKLRHVDMLLEGAATAASRVTRLEIESGDR